MKYCTRSYVDMIYNRCISMDMKHYVQRWKHLRFEKVFDHNLGVIGVSIRARRHPNLFFNAGTTRLLCIMYIDGSFLVREYMEEYLSNSYRVQSDFRRMLREEFTRTGKTKNIGGVTYELHKRKPLGEVTDMIENTRNFSDYIRQRRAHE